MKISRRMLALVACLVAVALASTLTTTSTAAPLCNGGEWTVAGCEHSNNATYVIGGCVASLGSACYKCWYTCEGGGASKCGESVDGGARGCFNIRYQDALPLWWWT